MMLGIQFPIAFMTLFWNSSRRLDERYRTHVAGNVFHRHMG